jgi:hypothetical protein
MAGSVQLISFFMVVSLALASTINNNNGGSPEGYVEVMLG